MNVGKPEKNMETVNEPAEIRGLLNPVKLIDKATSDDELAIVRKGRDPVHSNLGALNNE